MAKVGKNENDNREVRRWSETAEVLTSSAKNHWDIGEELAILDFARAREDRRSAFHRLSRRGSAGWSARSLTSCLTYTREKMAIRRCCHRVLCKSAALVGTGQLPKFEEDLFHLAPGDYFLIPTAEVPLTNLHRDEMLEQ